MSGRRGSSPIMVENLTSDEFARIAQSRPLVIVPLGSVEEHGAHLPLCTDAFQAEEVARRVALAFGGLVCPSVQYGESRSTKNFPGTLSLRTETVQSLAFDIVSELARNGIDKIMLLSGHAGSAHMAALRSGALRAVEMFPRIKVMVLSDYDLAYDLKGKEFPEDDGHAGLIETSRMLAQKPRLVRKARPSGRSRPPKFMVLPDPEKYFPSGVMGDSKGATAARGRRIDDYVVEALCELAERNFGIRRVKG